MDKTKFRKRKYHRGKHAEGKWVFKGVEKGMESFFFVLVPARNKK